jgi:uncharacterized protein (TIGR02453 family)
MKKEVLEFLGELAQNNNRPWFQDHKEEFDSAKAEMDLFFKSIDQGLKELDEFQDYKFYRIYRDIRFSKDKTPYKDHFGAIFKRKQPQNRGSFYIHIQPGNSFVGGGFWGPERDDLLRIRKAIAIEVELEEILENPDFKENFGEMKGEKLKNVPKEFEKDHPRGELLKYKQFLLMKNYSDKEVLSDDFVDKLLADYKLMLPFFHYMTEVLTTNENGEYLF